MVQPPVVSFAHSSRRGRGESWSLSPQQTQMGQETGGLAADVCVSTKRKSSRTTGSSTSRKSLF